MSNFVAKTAGTVNLVAGIATGAATVSVGLRPSALRVFNSGAVPVFVEFSTSGAPVSATITASTPIAPGGTDYFEKGMNDVVTAITGSGTATVYFTPGDGR